MILATPTLVTVLVTTPSPLVAGLVPLVTVLAVAVITVGSKTAAATTPTLVAVWRAPSLWPPVARAAAVAAVALVAVAAVTVRLLAFAAVAHLVVPAAALEAAPLQRARRTVVFPCTAHEAERAPTPPVESQHSCQPTVKLYILPLVWIFPLGKG